MTALPSEMQQRAMARLNNDTDFKMFQQWLLDEEKVVLDALLASVSTITVHQLQGRAQLLRDIREQVTASTK